MRTQKESDAVQSSFDSKKSSFTVAMLCNCLLTRRNPATLFARFLRGVVRQGCWKCFLAPLEMVVLLTLVQPEWTDYVHHEQTNKHYYEHPRIWKHNDTSVTKKRRPRLIARPNKKRGLPCKSFLLVTPFWKNKLRKLCLRRALKEAWLHYTTLVLNSLFEQRDIYKALQ